MKALYKLNLGAIAFAIMQSLIVTAAAQTSANPKDAQYTLGEIVISQPWTRVTSKGVPVGGGFVTITNKGTAPDILLGGTFSLAKRVEIHKTSMKDGVMRMRHMDGGVPIKPGETIVLKPGGLHLMFMQLKSPVTAGKRPRGSLVFKKAGAIEIDFAVARMGSPRPPE